MRFFHWAMMFCVFGFSCKPTSNPEDASAVMGSESTGALSSLYEGESIQHLSDWAKVTDEQVAQTKKEIMSALRKVGFLTLPDLSVDEIKVTYFADNALISVYSVSKYCVGEDRSSCFHLEIFPKKEDEHEVAVLRLPAYDNLKDIASNYSEDGVEELLSTLRETFPHDLLKDQLNVSSQGKDKNLTLVLLTDETPRRELHIEASDGSINNPANAHFRYHVYADEMPDTSTQ